MEYLDLNDLDFSALNYRSKAIGLRKWLLTALEYYPASFLNISIETGICYRALLNYVNGKSKSMNYRNMLALKLYIQNLMRDTSSFKLEDIKDEEFFTDS